MEELKRFFVIGKYVETIYAKDKTQAKEKYIEISKQLNRVENFDNIKVEEKPFK